MVPGKDSRRARARVRAGRLALVLTLMAATALGGVLQACGGEEELAAGFCLR